MGQANRALGIGKEAHHRWPEGRSEQGASKAKEGPLARGALARGFPILQKTGSIQAGSSKNFVAKGSAEWIRSTFTP
jgi:hypothetical protein